ncbi:cytochrome c3 family protein [Chloroflexota bacterium]
MRRGLIIVAALLIIVIVGVTLALSSTVKDKTLTAEELGGIDQACIDCHEDDLTGGSIHGVHVEVACFSCHDSSHTVHASADCQDCHAGTAGLKTADRAYDTLKWVGIGGAGLVILILALNLVVSRRRLGKREE